MTRLAGELATAANWTGILLRRRGLRLLPGALPRGVEIALGAALPLVGAWVGVGLLLVSAWMLATGRDDASLRLFGAGAFTWLGSVFWATWFNGRSRAPPRRVKAP